MPGFLRRLKTARSQLSPISKKSKPATLSNNRRGWRYWFRLTRFFVIILTIVVLSLPILLGFLFMLGLLYGSCGESHLTPIDYGYPAESVTVRARGGGSFRGYFIPGTNRATIIMPPPLNSGRSVRLPEAAILARHGYAIFMFESRRCAGMGPVSLGYREVDDVADTLAYLVTRPDVDPNRIGIHGFSSAGATSVMAAARLPELRAVIAEGGYGNFIQNTLNRHNSDIVAAYFLTLFRWTIVVTYELVTGLDINQLSPVSVIREIEPRPILLIYGTRENSLAGGRQQKAAAGDNTQLWIVEGAGHGNYLNVAPEAYEERVVTFFDEALLEIGD